jgi:hypothetical protein
MAILVSCTHLILGQIWWIVKLKFYVTSSSFTKHPYFLKNVILCKFLEQCYKLLSTMVEKWSYTLIPFPLLCFLTSSKGKVYPLAHTTIIFWTRMKIYLKLWIDFNFIMFIYIICKSRDMCHHISILMPLIV